MRYRAVVIPVAGVLLVVVGFLVFGNLNDNLTYYLTPAEAVSKKADFHDGKRFRLGGLVENGSVERTGTEVRFQLANDLTADSVTVPVVFSGAPSQLFAAGIGVIVEGTWRGDTFYSNTMIVKHDENYRPPSGNASADPGKANP